MSFLPFWYQQHPIYLAPFYILIITIYFLGIADFEEKIEDWVNDTDANSGYSWVLSLINQFYGGFGDDQNIIVQDHEQENTTKNISKVTSFPK